MKRYVDTSVLVGFVVNEVHTTQIRHRMQDTRWLNVISDWTVTEFYAALAFKLRTKQITSEVKREAEAFFEHAKAAMFEIIAVQRSDFRLATALGSRPPTGVTRRRCASYGAGATRRRHALDGGLSL